MTYILDFLIHGPGILLTLEHGLDGLPAGRHIVEILLLARLLLLSLAELLGYLVSHVDRIEQGLNVEQLALGPVVQVEVGVLQIHFQVVCLFELLVAEHHLVFLALDVVRQIQLLVLVQNTQKVVVVCVVLRLVLHVNRNFLLHFSQKWHDLSGEVLELLALSVKGLLLDWIVHVLLNIE